MRLPSFLWVFAMCLVFACATEAQSTSRCAHCGMRVDPTGLVAGATAVDGSALAFDSAKCMFRHRQAHADVRAAWVTDYYARTHAPIETAFFVLGSDVSGAMGADLIAHATRADADRFAREHHGTSVLSLPEVTSAVIDGLFGGHGR